MQDESELTDIFDGNAREIADKFGGGDMDESDDIVCALFKTSWRADTHQNAEPSRAQKLDLYMERLKEQGYKFSLSGHDLMSQRWKRYINADDNISIKNDYLAKKEDEKLAFRCEFANGRYEVWEATCTETRTPEGRLVMSSCLCICASAQRVSPH